MYSTIYILVKVDTKKSYQPIDYFLAILCIYKCYICTLHRLAAEAELLVLRRRRIHIRSDLTVAEASKAEAHSEQQRHNKREWRKSLPCRLETVHQNSHHQPVCKHSDKNGIANTGSCCSLSTSVELSLSSGSFSSSQAGSQTKLNLLPNFD